MALTRIDGAAVGKLWRSELPRPLDVLNLIHLRDERSYARYGVAVAPALQAVGGRLLWMGKHEQTLSGESQAQRLMVVRYPTHRRMLAMAINPYYMLINRLRERGVRSFEASFTFADEQPQPLLEQRRLLVVHFNEPTTLQAVRTRFEPAVGPLVYASHEVAAVSVLRGQRPTDPNPLTYKLLAFFAVGEADGQPELDDGDGMAISLYRYTPARALLAKAR